MKIKFICAVFNLHGVHFVKLITLLTDEDKKKKKVMGYWRNGLDQRMDGRRIKTRSKNSNPRPPTIRSGKKEERAKITSALLFK